MSENDKTRLDLGQVFGLSSREFRDHFSILTSTDISGFRGSESVYPTSNEPYEESVLALLKDSRPLIESGIMVGIAGGYDMAITLAATAGINRVILIDGNRFACDQAIWRTDLMKVCNTWTEYIQAIYPGKIDLDGIFEFVNNWEVDVLKAFPQATNLAKRLAIKMAVDKSFDGQRFKQANFFMPNKFLDKLQYSSNFKDRIFQILNANGAWYVDNELKLQEVGFTPGIKELVGNILLNDNHWLRPQNYGRARHMNIKVLQCPLQYFDKCPIWPLVTKQSNKLFFVSNVLQYLGNGDYEKFKQLLISAAWDTETLMIWSAMIRKQGMVMDSMTVAEFLAGESVERIRHNFWKNDREDLDIKWVEDSGEC